MAKTKKLKYKQADGTLSDYIDIGAEAINIDLAEGITLEDLNNKIVRVENSILKDSKGNIINPITTVESISNSSGETLTSLLNNAIIQFSIMPEPSAEYENRIIQYIGENTKNPYYDQGYFYQCVYSYIFDDSTDTGSYGYIWRQVEVQMTEHWDFDDTPTANSWNPVTSQGIKTYVDSQISNIDLSNYYTKIETDNLLNNINLSNYYTKTEIDAMLGDIETLLSNI